MPVSYSRWSCLVAGVKSCWKEINIQAIIWGNTVRTNLLNIKCCYVCMYPFMMSPYSHYFLISSLYIHIHTILPQIVTWTFISFQQFFIPSTKGDRCLLVEDSRAIYNLWFQQWILMAADNAWSISSVFKSFRSINSEDLTLYF